VAAHHTCVFDPFYTVNLPKLKGKKAYKLVLDVTLSIAMQC
jgi:hypothetical protein